MPSSYLILCHPLLLLPPIPSSIRVFANESTLRTRWPKYWSFSLSMGPSNEHPGLISFMDWMIFTDWISFQSKGLSRIFSNTTVQKHQFGVLFLPPSDAYVRSFLYLLYTLIKLYYTKALKKKKILIRWQSFIVS